MSVELDVNLSIAGLLKNLNDVRSSAEKFKGEMLATSKVVTGGFETVRAGSSAMSSEIIKTFSVIKQNQNEISKLTTELNAFRAAQGAGFDTKKLEEYRKKVAELEAQLKKLKNEQNQPANPKGDITGGMASRIDQTRFAMTQIVREMPAFSYSMSTGFMAISNNIPMLIDQIQKLKAANAALAASGQPTVSIFKTLTSTIFSWQTGLLIAITALTIFGKQIGEWATSLFDAKKKTDEFTKSREILNGVFEEGAKSAAKDVAKMEQYRDVLNDLNVPATERIKVAKEYNEVADKTNQIDVTQINNLKEINKQISAQTQLIVQRAVAMAAQSKLAEYANKMIEIELKLRQGIADAGVTEADVLKAVTNERDKAIKSVENQQKQFSNAPKELFIPEAAAKKDVANIKLVSGALMDLLRSRDSAKRELEKASDLLGNLLTPASVTKQEKVDKEETAKRIKEATDRADKILALEKQLAEAKVSLMAESREKALQEERNRFATTVRGFEIMQDEAARAAEKIIADAKQQKRGLTDQDKKVLGQIQTEVELIQKNIEIQTQVHNNNMLKINKEYYTKAVDAFEKAQEGINAFVFTEEEKEISAINKRFNGIIKAIEDAKEKMKATTNDPVKLAFIEIVSADQSAEAERLRQEAINNAVFEAGQKRLDIEKKIALTSVEIIKQTGIGQLEEIEIKERLKLEIEKTFAERRLENLKKHYKLENTLTDNIIASLMNPKNIKAAAESGQDIFEFLGVEIKDEKAKQQIIDAIKDIQKTGKALIVNDEKKKYDLFEVLGITDEDTKEKINLALKGIGMLGEALSGLADEMVKAVDLQIEQRKRIIDAIDEQIDKQKDAVDREKELMEQGLANNFDAEQRRLAQLEKDRAAEMAQAEKLQKQRQDLQRKQLIADSFAQGSNLITASTEIYKTLSPLGPIGIALAVGTIAAMIGGFVQAKVNAYKAISDVPKLRKGGAVDIDALRGAARHEEGGVGLYDEKTGKRLAEFEGDEKIVVINRESSKKYEPLLHAINKDELSKWSIDRFRGLIQPSNITLNTNTQQRLIEGSKEAVITHNSTSVTNVHNTGADKLSYEALKEIAANTKSLRKIEEEREEITETPEMRIIKKGYHTRIIHKTDNKNGSV